MTSEELRNQIETLKNDIQRDQQALSEDEKTLEQSKSHFKESLRRNDETGKNSSALSLLENDVLKLQNRIDFRKENISERETELAVLQGDLEEALRQEKITSDLMAYTEQKEAFFTPVRQAMETFEGANVAVVSLQNLVPLVASSIGEIEFTKLRMEIDGISEKLKTISRNIDEFVNVLGQKYFAGSKGEGSMNGGIRTTTTTDYVRANELRGGPQSHHQRHIEKFQEYYKAIPRIKHGEKAVKIG